MNGLVFLAVKWPFHISFSICLSFLTSSIEHWSLLGEFFQTALYCFSPWTWFTRRIGAGMYILHRASILLLFFYFKGHNAILAYINFWRYPWNFHQYLAICSPESCNSFTGISVIVHLFLRKKEWTNWGIPVNKFMVIGEQMKITISEIQI